MGPVSAGKSNVTISIKNKGAVSEMAEGTKVKLKVSVNKGKVVFKSSDTEVAKVGKKNGVVKAVSEGKATITVISTKDSDVSAKVKVKVVKASIDEAEFASDEYHYELYLEDETTDYDAYEEDYDDEDDDLECIEWEDEDDSDYENVYYIITDPIQIDPADYDEYFTFESSDTSVATVDEYGNIYPLNYGTTVISATARDGVGPDIGTITMTLYVDNPDFTEDDEEDDGEW